ncbi:MAG: 50S ribosomal protein L32 [Candidatus Sumerlaeia bacterium]
MAVPKKRTSPSKRNRRRCHHKLGEKRYSTCPNCNAVRMPHRICPSCGYYKDRAYVTKVEM